MVAQYKLLKNSIEPGKLGWKTLAETSKNGEGLTMSTPRTKPKLENNVLSFINQCADSYGRVAADSLNQELWVWMP